MRRSTKGKAVRPTKKAVRARAARLLEVVDNSSAEPLQAQIFRGLRRLISGGVLAPGSKLPSSRRLAGDFRLSRNTVIAALEQLGADGWIEARRGSGTYVARVLPSKLRSEMRLSLPPDSPEAAPFAIGMPALDLFPMETWSRLQSKRWRMMPRVALREGASGGWSGLRWSIASHLRISHGIACDSDQVIITNGTRGSIYLAGRVLAKPGECAWVEDPGCIGAKDALRTQGIEVVPLPVDKDGLDVEFGRQIAPQARLAMVTSQCQFPTGAVLSETRRRRLISWASESEGWILDDGYDSDVYFIGPRSRSIAAEESDRVIFAHSFNHTMFPALRIGYLVVPKQLVDAFTVARRALDGFSNVPNQMVLHDFVEGGYYDEHIRRCREAYSERRAVLIDALNDQLGGWLHVEESARGRHIVARVPNDAVAQVVAARARAVGIQLLPVSHFTERRVIDQRLLLGFSGFHPSALRAGVKRLSRACNGLLPPGA